MSELYSIYKGIKTTLLFLIFLNPTTNAQTSKSSTAIPMGIGIEFAAKTVAILPNFFFSVGQKKIGSSKIDFTSQFRMGFGSEKGYYTGSTKNSAVVNEIKSQMEGNQLMKYNYHGLSSGAVFTFAYIPTFIVPTNSRIQNNSRQILNWIYLGVGLKITNHYKTVGDYSVVSRDSQYEYTELMDIEFHDRFWDVSPVFVLNGKKIGFSYSPQSVFDKSVTNHTFILHYTWIL